MDLENDGNIRTAIAIFTCDNDVDPNNDDLTHIIIPEFMYFGSCRSGSAKSELQNLGITHILNCTGSQFKNRYLELFTYKNLNLEDRIDKEGSLLFHLEAALKFIEECKEGKGRILIHCMEGKSRSASVVIAYLMKAYTLSVTTAFQVVKSKRAIAQPNSNFMKQLIEFEHKLQLQNKQQ